MAAVAPMTAPKVDDMPPNTTIATSSMEWKKLALPGVMKPE